MMTKIKQQEKSKNYTNLLRLNKKENVTHLKFFIRDIYKHSLDYKNFNSHLSGNIYSKITNNFFT
jgi:hypothetical protein